MNKICCIEDASVCPKSSSCSMVLRSACSHSHSRELTTVNEHSHASIARKSKHGSKKDSSSKTVTLESALESSFKHLALKSAEKTYSLLKEGFYNSFDFSERADQKLYEASSLNVSCARELEFSPLSVSNSSYVFNNVSQKEYNSDYSSAYESDINSSESFSSTSKMSKSSTPTRRFTRSSVSTVRCLSGSEGEDDDIRVQKIVRPGRNISESSSTYNSNILRKTAYTEREVNGRYYSNNHDSDLQSRHIVKNHADSSSSDSRTRLIDPVDLGRSTIQYSLLDRFRWFLWRWAYLKIITNIKFDVWFLSRIRDYGRFRVIFYLLLPLLLFLVWGIFQSSPVSFEDVSQTIKSAVSFFVSLWSPMFSYLYGFFVQKEEIVTESDKCAEPGCNLESSRILSSLAGVLGLLSRLFVRDGNSDSSITESTHAAKGSEYHKTQEQINLFQPSKEEMKILAAQVFKDELNSLNEFIKTSVHKTKTENEKRALKLQEEMKNLQFEVQSLSGSLLRFESDIQKEKEKSEKKEDIIALTSEYKRDIEHLHDKLKIMETKLGVLNQLKSCCDKQLSPGDFIALLEKHLMSAFKRVVDGDTDPSSKYYFFNQWLTSKFFSREKLIQEIDIALKKQSLNSEKQINYDSVIKVIEGTVVKHVDSIKKNLTDANRFSYSSVTDDYFSEDKIKKIVKEAIMLYDADKTGQVDYALESGGGSVLGTRCSETYVEKHGKISFFGVPIWTSSNSPRTAIQPDVQPGRCWAFKGSQGFLVLELSATIYPSGFTLEHIPVSLSPTGSIDSAPKSFSVWGLESEKDNQGMLLGQYQYEINGEPLQYFPVQTPSGQAYNYVELQIHSNHGNLEYTCLYRFRVHGKRAL